MTSRNVAQEDGTIAIWPIDQLTQADTSKVERRWNFGLDSIHSNLHRIVVLPVGDSIDLFLTHEETVPKTVWTGGDFDAGNHGNTLLINILGEKRFDFPKSIRLVQKCVALAVPDSENQSYILDYFAGSGTTGHAVVNLNRESGGQCSRKFILVEMGAYFESVLKERISKVLFSPGWIDGTPQTFNSGMSCLVKYFALEPYDDVLTNCASVSPLTAAAGKEMSSELAIQYSFTESPLKLDAFRDPWEHTFETQLAGEYERQRHRVDLVETFNYLIGLTVSSYGPIERYQADFKRVSHADGMARLVVDGRLRLFRSGDLWFQRVEGDLNDGTRVLVIWRKLTDDPEQDAAVLDAWIARHREDTKQRSAHRDYHRIYINGPITLPQPTQELRTVFPIEQTFKELMFAGTEDV